MKKLPYQEYRKKLKGCFIGKAIGGTLGMPYEGKVGIRSVDYYDPVPTAMTENDDLDLQVVWLSVIRENGLPINRFDLAKGWQKHMRVACDEYGVVLRNLAANLYPPFSGSFDTKFGSGMGAAIRSEIWAALAPGDPALAVQLAKEDACVDHVGDGIYAEMFLVAVESAAYLCSDPQELIQIGLSFIPKQSRLSQALRYTLSCCAQSDEPFAIREKVLMRYFVQNWTDVSINLCMILIAWICGKGDTSASLCLAAELGHDTDCTCATLGSILGIIAPDGFEKRWTDPIGEDLVLSSCIANMHEVGSIGAFCLQIAEVCADVLQYYHSDVVLQDAPYFSKSYTGPFMEHPEALIPLSDENPNDSLLGVRPLVVMLCYPEEPALAAGETKTYQLTVVDPTYSLQKCGLQLSCSDSLSLSKRCQILTFDENHMASAAITVTAAADRPRRSANHLLKLRFEINGFKYDYTAGIPMVYEFYRTPADAQAIPEICPPITAFADAAIDRSACHYRPVSSGAWLYTVEFRHPNAVADCLLIVSGTRGMKAWVDDQLVLDHDSCEYVPAFHRSENTAQIAFDANWHRLTIWVDAANAPIPPSDEESHQTNNLSLRAQRYLYDKKNLVSDQDGELFVGFSSRRGLLYLQEMEWRLPKIETPEQ